MINFAWYHSIRLLSNSSKQNQIHTFSSILGLSSRSFRISIQATKMSQKRKKKKERKKKKKEKDSSNVHMTVLKKERWFMQKFAWYTIWNGRNIEKKDIIKCKLSLYNKNTSIHIFFLLNFFIVVADNTLCV